MPGDIARMPRGYTPQRVFGGQGNRVCLLLQALLANGKVGCRRERSEASERHKHQQNSKDAAGTAFRPLVSLATWHLEPALALARALGRPGHC